jgi:gas vesicle protein
MLPNRVCNSAAHGANIRTRGLFIANLRLRPDWARLERQGGHMSDRDGSSFLWFLAGLGIGAAVGILYAPKAGDELRQQLREAAEEGRETVKQRARQAREQAGSWAEKGRDYLNQQKDQIRSAYEAGRQAYRDATSQDVEGTTPNVP